jgi:hypothetical protein
MYSGQRNGEWMPAYTNAKQVIPAQFIEIMRNDRERALLKAQPIIDFNKGAALIKERREYTRNAERILRWNKDKGNTK